MGITLTSKSIASTYDGLLKLSDNDPLSGAFKVVTDGFGNESGIQLNNSGDVNIAGILNVGTRVNTPILQLTGGTGDQGTFSWNSDEWTVDLIQNGTTLQLGQEVQIHVKNQSGATIPDGAPVYATGTLGASGRITVAPMIADGSIPAKYFLGVATETIANGADGKITTFGKIRGIDTSAYAEGQTLWVSATSAGNFQTTRPLAPNLDLEVAIVINSHANNGTIFVRANNGHYLGTAHDVNISSVAENDLLVYKTNRWVNTKSIGDLSAANVTLSGYLRGPATFVIDPAAYGDETGLVQILGDLRVDGITTTINSTTISVSDKNITLAKDAVTAGDANGAGITIAGANATLTYLSATDDFTFNKNVNASRFVGPLTGDVTGNADTADALATAVNIALTGSITGNADFDGSGDIIITTTTNHNHDDIYYTETEVGNFFSGSTVIAGYNKTNWDAAYNDKINSGYFDSNTGDLVLTQQDNDTLTINFDDRYVIANTGNFKTNTYSVESPVGTQRYKLMTTSGQVDQFFHITINRAYDYGDNDQTKQQAIYQRRQTNKNLRWRLDGDLTATSQVFIEIYAKANGDDEVWLVCTDYAKPQVYVEHDGFFWNGLTTADTPTGTLIKTTELTASNKPNWDEQVGLVKTTELYSDTTYLRGSAFVLAPNGSSYDTLVYRDGTNPHVLYAGGGTSTQWNTAYNYSQVGHLPLAGGDVTGTVTIGGKLGVGVTPSDWSLSGLSAMQIKNAGFYGYSTTEYGLGGNVYYNGGWKYIANGFAQLYVGVNGEHIWYTYASGIAGAAAINVQTMRLNTAGNLTIAGTLSASGYNNTNWDTAYGWGNHAGLYSLVGHTHDLIRHSLAAPALIDGMTSTTFRTSLFGSNTNGYAISTSRWNTTPAALSGMNSYGTLFAWSGSDTHGFIATDYSTANIQVGGGYGDNITWKATLIHSSNIGSQSVAYAASAGNASTLDSLDSSQFLRSDTSDTMTGNLTVSGNVRAGNGFQSALLVAATGTATTQNAIAIQQLTTEGDTIIFADYEPYAEYGMIARNSLDSIDFTAGTTTNSIDSYNITNRSGNERTAHVKARISLGSGNASFGGSVGIGTTSPQDLLNIHNSSANANIGLKITRGTQTHGLRLGVNDSHAFLWTTEAQDLAFATSNIQRLTIQSGGNVGIGTTSPSARLTIADEDGVESQLQVRNYATSSTGSFTGNYMVELRSAYATGSTGGALLVHTQESSDARPTMQVSSTAGVFATFVNGKVGIGTNSPEQKLHVEGTIQLGNENDLAWAYDNGSYYNYIKNFYNTTDGMVFRSGLWTSGQSIITHSFETYTGGWQKRLVIRQDGSVGIGTTSPAHKLDVAGTTNSYLYRIAGVNGLSGYVLPQGYWLGGGSTATNLSFAAETGNGLAFFTNGTTDFRMFINTSGNVGIGTTSPQQKLDVQGSATIGDYTSTNYVFMYDGYVDGSSSYYQAPRVNIGLSSAAAGGVDEAPVHLFLHNSNGTDGSWVKLSMGGKETAAGGNTVSWAGIAAKKTSGTLNSWASGDLYLWTKASSTHVVNMVLKSSGYVGIGTTSPSEKLQVVGSAAIINVNSTSAGANANVHFQTTARKWGIGPNMALGSSDFEIYDYTAGQNRLVINSSGSVGIGVTSPGYKLHVNGPGGFGSDGASRVLYLRQNVVNGGNIVQFQDQNGTNIWEVVGRNNQFYIYNGAAGNASIYVTPNANNYVGIGKFSASYKLDVEGTIRAAGDVLAYSDARVKENVKTIDNALDKVMSMRGVSYNRTDNDDKTKKVGVIAQEIQKVLPEVVSEQEDGMLSVSYGNIVGVLIEAIKEQQKQIDELKALLNVSPK